MVIEKIGTNEIFEFIRENLDIDLSKIEKEDVAFSCEYVTEDKQSYYKKTFIVGENKIVVSDFTFELNGKKENIFKPWIVFVAKKADNQKEYVKAFEQFVENKKAKWVCQQARESSTYDLAKGLCDISRKSIECVKELYR